jgi:acyl-CoA reductase-like NAD-dependent aldehyde dehydrogenase
MPTQATRKPSSNSGSKLRSKSNLNVKTRNTKPKKEAELDNKTIQSIQKIFDSQKAKSLELRQSTPAERIEKLKKIQESILRNQIKIQEALRKDFKKQIFQKFSQLSVNLKTQSVT